MTNEKGTLPVGIEYGGQLHKEFEVRPQLVRDSIDASEHPRAKKNESFYGLFLVSRQLVRLGDIPKDKVTPELLLDMQAVDLREITDATRRLEKSLLTFRGGAAPSVPKAGPGDAEAGVPV